MSFDRNATGRRIERYALVTAIVMHAGGLFATRLFPEVNLLARQHAREVELTDVEIEKEDIPDVREPEPVDEVDPDNTQAAAIIDPSITAERRRDRKRAADPSAGGTGDPNAESATGNGEVVDDGTGDGPGEQWSQDDGGWAPPGVGTNGPIYQDPSLFELHQPGPAAPKKAPRARKADREIANKILKAELRAKDKQLGLDLPAAGTVASIFRAAVLASDTPATARASFAVALGPGGQVKSVKFISSSAGSAAQWEAIAASVKATLNARKLALTGDYAKGANIAIAVQSKMTMPSGAKVDAGIEASLTQKFDVSDIGAKPVRTVTASHSASPVE